jgi:hypothetical protein
VQGKILKPYVHRLDVDNLLIGTNDDSQLIIRAREKNQTACRSVNAASNLASQPARCVCVCVCVCWRMLTYANVR